MIIQSEPKLVQREIRIAVEMRIKRPPISFLTRWWFALGAAAVCAPLLAANPTMAQSAPSASETAAYAGLHRAAARWYAGQGRPADAIGHAAAGQDFEQAADLIEQALPEARRLKFHCLERGHGRFSREIHLFSPVNTHKGRARLADGLLTLEFPKIEDKRQEARLLHIEEGEESSRLQ